MKVKTRLVWIAASLAILCAVAVAGYLLIPAFHSSSELVFEYDTLPEDSAILARTRVQGYGVHQGDAFPYTVEVLYDPAQISEVDTASLDMNVNLAPFELRDTKEAEIDVDARTRVYRKEYTIQLIEGSVNTRYDFPSIVVRYQLKDSADFAEKTIVPDPVFVASRLPADSEELELKPLRGKIVDESQRRLPWILWALGGLLGVLGVVDVSWRVLPQWRARDKQEGKVSNGDVLAQAYRSLHANIDAGCEPRQTLRQMDYILRIVMARKGGTGWLEEPDFSQVPGDIQSQIVSLTRVGQNGSGASATPQDVNAALGQLEEVLAFYYGVDVDTWKH